MQLPHRLSELGVTVGPDKITLLVPVIEARRLTTNASTTPVTDDITNEAIRRLAPFSNAVQAYTTTENSTANFQWKVQFQSSNTGRTFGTATDLFAYITSDGEDTQNAYTTTGLMGLNTRFGLVYANTSGTNVESAVVWLWLAFRLRS